MGQRTVTVVRLHYKLKDNKKFRYITKAYHNQWGWGRGMLNEVLAGFIRLDKFVYLGVKSCVVENEIKLKADSGMLGGKFYDITDEYEDKAYFNGEIIDMAQVIYNHDNNDGGCLLDVELNEYSQVKQAMLWIYNHAGKRITLKKWSNLYPEFCNEEWQTGFRAMFENLGGKVA